jgi:antitoxin VapB
VALQIANPAVVAKVDRLAKATGLTKTAVVEKAVDLMARDVAGVTASVKSMATILAQADRIPDRHDAFDPLEWDDLGLPR